jgi:hypothetical protein
VRRANIVVLAATVLSLGACGKRSSPVGVLDAGTNAHVPTDAGRAVTTEGSPDAPAATPDATAEVGFEDTQLDAPSDAPPDTPVPPECTAGVRTCLDGQTMRVCSDQGRWIPGSCAAGSACSGGACVCQAGACEDGVLREGTGYVSRIAVGGSWLYYEYYVSDTDHAIHSIDLRSGMPGPIQRPTAGWYVNTGLAADGMGALHWCRRLSDENAPIAGALMRGDLVLAPGACTRLRLDASHIYYTLEEEQGLFRRALRAGGGLGDRETVTTRYPASFAVTGAFIYLATPHDTLERKVIDRIARDDLKRVDRLAERAGWDSPVFDEMAVDASYVYVSYEDQILRTPITDGGTFETFANAAGPEVAAIVLADTHVYWATSTPSPNGCSEAGFWRRSKARDDEPVLLARRAGVCPNGLELAGERLYAAVAGRPRPSQILRLRR